MNRHSAQRRLPRRVGLTWSESRGWMSLIFTPAVGPSLPMLTSPLWCHKGNWRFNNTTHANDSRGEPVVARGKSFLFGDCLLEQKWNCKGLFKPPISYSGFQSDGSHRPERGQVKIWLFDANVDAKIKVNKTVMIIFNFSVIIYLWKQLLRGQQTNK